uniref:Mab-21-like nucleotidyltransferase domain-containing protein n=1 Tax=Branchiostoma floridae TaxID=7739 RepID=C3YLL9_BRAFL|eukprot:XP_002602776.1 hypothetical protein BRAFLDRAFT_93722 [Branchiostoma floridae]
MSLTEQLRRLKLDEDQTKRAKELVRKFIGAIVENVKEEIDEGRPQRANRCRIEYTGSMYEGTKFGQPDEFDIMIVIDGSEDIKSEKMTPGYARLRTKQHPSLPHRFSKCFDQYQNINPTKMLDWFYGLVQKGENKIPGTPSGTISLKVSRHGPAVMVNIKDRDGLPIDVDLVPCIQLDQQTYYVAKPYKPYADEPPDWSLRCDPAMLWRQSFSVTETRTLSRIESCLRDRRLPHFYLPELNLLDGIRRETIENMRYRIKRLIDSEHERNKVLSSC